MERTTGFEPATLTFGKVMEFVRADGWNPLSRLWSVGSSAQSAESAPVRSRLFNALNRATNSTPPSTPRWPFTRRSRRRAVRHQAPGRRHRRALRQIRVRKFDDAVKGRDRRVTGRAYGHRVAHVGGTGGTALPGYRPAHGRERYRRHVSGHSADPESPRTRRGWTRDG